MKNKTIIFTGGTGGHVIPAVNFGNFLLSKGYICLLITDQRGSKYINNFKGKVYVINASHFSGNYIMRFKSFLNLLIGLIQSLIIVIKIRPKRCISFGSYATLNPLIIMLLFKLFYKNYIYIHEQNSILGKVNLFILPFARALFTNFKVLNNLDHKYFKKTHNVGLPNNIFINSKFVNIDKESKKIIFIYGGSQGSAPMLKKLLIILENIKDNYFSQFKLILQAPKQIQPVMKKTLNNLKIDFEINDFYSNIDEILTIAHIVISRAGAGTINNIINYKIPSIIIPLPNSIYNHQYYNAKYLSDMNAAILLDEKNFNIDTTFKILKELMEKSKHQNMKNQLKKLILPNANKEIFQKIFI